MPRVLLICLIVLASQVASAQILLKGVVRDEAERRPLRGAIVQISELGSGQQRGYAVTQREGDFQIRLQSSATRLLLTIRSIGYTAISDTIPAKSATYSYYLSEEEVALPEVTVRAPAIRHKSDTITYFAPQIKGAGDRVLADLLQHLPGIEVSTTGQIQYQGKPISKFYIEDLDMLGGQYGLATKNIHADDVASIQVYEGHQPIKVLQGMNREEAAALNIRLKEHAKQRPIGFVEAGGGAGDGIGSYEGALFGLLVQSKRQRLAMLKGNSIGEDYEAEGVMHFTTITFPTLFAYTLLDSDPIGTPSISKQQYLHNHSGILAYNGIHKLPSEATIAVKAGGSGYHNRYSQEQKRWLQTPKGMFEIDEGGSSLRQQLQGTLEVTYERNHKARYITNSTRLELLGMKEHYALNPQQPITQKTQGRSWSVANGLKYLWSHEQGVSELRSTIALARMPGGGQILSEGRERAGAKQSLGGTLFYTEHKMGHTWQWGLQHYVGIEGRLRTRWEQVQTELLQSVTETHHEGQQPAINDLSGWEIEAHLRPFYRYHSRSNRLSAELGIPLLFLTTQYQERSTPQSQQKASSLLPNLDLRLMWKATQMLQTTWSLETTQNMGDLRQYLTAPIMRNYRTIQTLGGADRFHFSALNSSLGVTYKNPFSNLFLALHANGGRSKSSHLQDLHLSQTSEEQQTIQHPSYAYHWSVASSGSKALFDLDLLLKLNLFYSGNLGEVMRHSTLIQTRLDAFGATGSIHWYLWQRRLVNRLECHYTHTWSQVPLLPTPLQTALLRAEYFASLVLSSHLDMGIRATYHHLRRGIVDREPPLQNLYLSGEATYRAGKWELRATLRNLANARFFLQSRSAQGDLYEHRYRLRPLEGILTARYLF